MKVVTLCDRGSCCPTVKIYEDHVEIGEAEKICVLSMEQWNILKQKIVKQEI
jgi:hypothetical protein